MPIVRVDETLELHEPDGTRYGVPVWHVPWRNHDWANGDTLRPLGLVQVGYDPSWAAAIMARRGPLGWWIRLAEGTMRGYYGLMAWLIARGILAEPARYAGVSIVTWRDHWACWRTLTLNPFAWGRRLLREQREARDRERELSRAQRYQQGRTEVLNELEAMTRPESPTYWRRTS